ncbi:MAG: glutathione S-transferase family protein [Rubrivivax sp.]|nr:MAG: glutathione S-transferase family protein [Rubrivivax sp.]
MSWTLYTFAMSHYSEKIRWTLDASNIDYREVRMTPVFHILPALLMGKRGKTTLPVVKTPQGSLQDSSRILLWLEKTRAPFALIPKALSQDIHAVERQFDAIGKDVARALYAASFGQGDAHILKLWTDDATPTQAVFVRQAYPFIRWAFRRKLNITQRGAARAHQRITEVIDWLEGQLSDGRTYLVGQQFTAADITAASLLAPIACPRQHPVYGDPVYQQTMVDATAPWRDRRALQWVRTMYDLHRGQFQNDGKARQAA